MSGLVIGFLFLEFCDQSHKSQVVTKKNKVKIGSKSKEFGEVFYITDVLKI